MCEPSVDRSKLRAVATWLREGSERQTGLAALPSSARDRAHRANASFGRLVRSRRGR